MYHYIFFIQGYPRTSLKKDVERHIIPPFCVRVSNVYRKSPVSKKTSETFLINIINHIIKQNEKKITF